MQCPKCGSKNIKEDSVTDDNAWVCVNCGKCWEEEEGTSQMYDNDTDVMED